MCCVCCVCRACFCADMASMTRHLRRTSPFRFLKYGSDRVRVRPDHPHLHVVAALVCRAARCSSASADEVLRAAWSAELRRGESGQVPLSLWTALALAHTRRDGDEVGCRSNTPSVGSASGSKAATTPVESVVELLSGCMTATVASPQWDAAPVLKPAPACGGIPWTGSPCRVVDAVHKVAAAVGVLARYLHAGKACQPSLGAVAFCCFHHRVSLS